MSEYTIAAQVAVAIVDALEVIEVDEAARQVAPVTLAATDLAVELGADRRIGIGDSRPRSWRAQAVVAPGINRRTGRPPRFEHASDETTAGPRQDRQSASAPGRAAGAEDVHETLGLVEDGEQADLGTGSDGDTTGDQVELAGGDGIGAGGGRRVPVTLART